MTEENEQLEKELKFLKESFESDIISEEEYKKRKETIEKKLTDIEEKGTKEAEQEEKKEDIEKKEEMQEIKKEEHEEKAEEEETKDTKEEIKIEEIKQEKLKEAEEEKQEVEDKEEEQKAEDETEETEESEKEEEKKEEPKDKEEEREVNDEEIGGLQEEEKPGKKKKTKLIMFSILIVIVFLIFYFYAFKATNEEKEDIIEFQPECVSDGDCETPNKIGTCLNPNTAEAVCEFIEDKETRLTIINDENCISCDTTRMLQIIKQLFPLVEITEINSDSEEGRKLISQLSLEALPSYVFESDIQETINFNKFKRALVEKQDKFIINPAASGSNYYFKRKSIRNKLDLFVLPSTPSSVEDNLQEVLELFEDNINYSKHIISDENEEKNLYKDFGITTYPVFIINNKLKFTGIQSAESIKSKFCELNQLSECKIQLSASLK